MVTAISWKLEVELDEFVRKPKAPSPEEKVNLAMRWLKEQGEPNDMLHTLVALKALDDLWRYYSGIGKEE